MPGLHLDRDDEFSEVITIAEAAQRVDVTVRTVNRWIKAKQLRTLGPTRLVVDREVRACEAARHRASKAGRPGPRVRLDVLTSGVSS